jgi:hypothetical protein
MAVATDYEILRDWTIAFLRTVRTDGSLIVPDLSPLTSKQIEGALAEVRDHPNYQGQTVSVPNSEGYRTILRTNTEGERIIETMPFADQPGPRKMPPGSAMFFDHDKETPDE